MPHAISGCLIATSIALGLSASENWLPRAIASALLLLGGVIILVSMILNRKFGFIGPRLVDRSLKLRLAVEILGRLVFLGLLVFVAPILFYMCLDFYGLMKRGYPIKTGAFVTYVPGGRYGIGRGRTLVCKRRTAKAALTTCSSIRSIPIWGNATR
jgi:hypothetical protein